MLHAHDGSLVTGFARKALLVLTVGFYFSAGVGKLSVAGPAWADGHTIAYFALERGASRPLGRLLIENLWLCTLLAIGSLTLEVGAPAALFSRKAKYALIVGWTCMHVGIRYAMGPRYFENIVCFALLVDWGAAARAVRERVRFPNFESDPASPPPVALRDTGGRTARGVAADHPRANYHDAAAAQEIARSYLRSHPPIEATEHFAFLAELRLAGGGSEPFPFEEEVPGISTHKQWILTIARPALSKTSRPSPRGRSSSIRNPPTFRPSVSCCTTFRCFGSMPNRACSAGTSAWS